MKHYEITITHQPGPEPVLPDHPDLRYEDPSPYSPYRCPTHSVFSRHCAIALARQHVERLKQVPAIVRIHIEENGTRGKDTWMRIDGQWSREW